MRLFRCIKGFLGILLCLMLVGCSNATATKKVEGTSSSSEKTSEIADAPSDKSENISQNEVRIVSTSVAICEILEKLEVPASWVVGVPTTQAYQIPEIYAQATSVGSPMSPDLEVISTLNPTMILSPNSLEGELSKNYAAIKQEGYYFDLKSIRGMYESIEAFGKLVGKEQEAETLLLEYENYIQTYQTKHENMDKKRVLILMGLPGSYVVATPNSYVGSLVKLAGGINIVEENETTNKSTEDFLNLNVEELLTLDPDLILRTSHAMPEMVAAMFEEEFKENEIWKHFRAVKENKVIDLNHELFGMSAGFDYPEALQELEQILYETNSEK